MLNGSYIFLSRHLLSACSDTHTVGRGIINVKGIRSLRRCCKNSTTTTTKKKKSVPSLELVELTTLSFCVVVYVLVFVSSVCYVGVSDNISEREALQVYETVLCSPCSRDVMKSYLTYQHFLSIFIR